MFDPRIAEQAARRWRARQAGREETQSRMARGGVAAVESAERISKRMDRLQRAAEREQRARVAAVMAAPVARAAIEEAGLERVIGRADFLGVGFLELGFAVARFVGRVVVREGARVAGFGTGFMVSPRLLLTNNHVLEDAATARGSEVEFDFQADRLGRMLPVRRFRLQPDLFFLTDEALDYTLVAVAERSQDGEALAGYGWSRLVGEEGKALLGDPLNIVQHPRGRAKELVVRSNELVDLLDDFAHYVTDTEPGSSGSPVYNDQWEVVALHHSGVPATDAAGRILDKDGNVWKRVDAADIQWVANEGVRVSRLVDHASRAPLASQEARRLRAELLELEAPDPLELLTRQVAALPVPPRPVPPPPGAGFSITVPLRLTLSLGGGPVALPGLVAEPAGGPTVPGPLDLAIATPAGGGVPAGGASPGQGPTAAAILAPTPDPLGGVPGVTPGLPLDADEGVSIDPDYASRAGYDALFLGPEHPVALPALPPALADKAALNREAAEGADPYVLPYHHYSVVQNAERRLAFFTAVNVDGEAALRPRRESDAWFFDPRIDRDAQAGNEIYTHNPLDRGHLVRRLDPAWGDAATAKVANDDTFHYTNCAPQHAGFNRSATTWAGLEDYVLDNADLHDLRVSVFTGPVFRDDDPRYRGIRLPQQFWKVVAAVKADGTLSATAYLLSQAHLIEGLEEEAFVFGAYRTYQVPVAKVAELTGLDLGDLPAADPLAAPAEAGLEEELVAVPLAREVRGFEDLVL